MGKLDYLEVENFKSYKGNQVIGPFYKFSAVIGPNGAGKSNLMDAISFVLGVKSLQLRSTSVKDLIYRGLTGSNEPEDNPTSAYVKAIYIKDDGQRVEFKRIVRASGSSDYYFDGSGVTYSVYSKILEGENILVKARNFLVFQGDVEAVASQSPKDLTKLIEQISGSIELKKEYEELQLLLDRATEESSFNFNKKRGMQAEVKQFMDQKAEAEKYQKLKVDIENMVVNLLVWRLFHIESKFRKIESELDKEDRQYDDRKEDLGRAEAKLQEAISNESKAKLDVKKFELQIKDKNAQLDLKQPSILTLEENLNHARSKLNRVQENLSKIQRDSQRQTETVQTLKDELEESKSALESHEEEARRLQLRDIGPADLVEYNRLKGELAVKTSALQQKLDQLERPERALRDQSATTQQIYQQLQHKLNRLNETQEDLTDREDELKKSIAQTQEDIQEAQNQLTAYVSEQARLEQQEKEINEKLAKILNELVQAKVDERANERDTKLKEGLETLKRVFPGVHGRLVDLIKPTQTKYEIAILTILGADLDAVIVDQEATAIDCIKYLKDQRLGSTKFIPLDTIMNQPIQDKFRHLEGSRLAVDVIQYDPQFERAIHYCTGNSLVCDSFSIAKSICYDQNLEVKAVSLDGTIIHRSGLITGGGAKVSSATKAARRWEEKKVDELKQQRDKLLIQLNEIQRSKRRGNIEEYLNSKVMGLKTNLEFLEDEKSKVSRNLESNRQEISHIEKQMSDAKQKYEQIRNQFRTAELKANETRQQISAEQDTIFSQFCSRLGFRDIREYEQRQIKATQEVIERNMKFKAIISKLENQLEFETRRLTETTVRLDQLKKIELADLKTVNDTLLSQQEIESECITIRSAIGKLHSKLASSQQKLEQATSLVHDKRRERNSTIQVLDGMSKSITANESVLARLDGERTLIFRRCKVEGLPIPLNMGALDSFDDTQTAKIAHAQDFEVTAESAVMRFRVKSSDWSIQVDFSNLSEKDKRDSSEEHGQEFEDQIANSYNEMDKMAPNLKAIDKLNEVQKRSQATEKEFEKARAMANDAKTRFNQVKLERYKLFYNAFEHISRAINDVYKELTQSKTFPMGGTAYLSLENNTEPYLDGIKYHAMPPMKRFRDMEQLSGGEKSVAALALLFSIQSVHPSPFFVLDEVDAALDNTNVSKVANYLRKHCNNTQFLVISLKPALFEKSHSLVGVCRDQSMNSSAVLTLDLEQYGTQ